MQTCSQTFASVYSCLGACAFDELASPARHSNTAPTPPQQVQHPPTADAQEEAEKKRAFRFSRVYARASMHSEQTGREALVAGITDVGRNLILQNVELFFECVERGNDDLFWSQGAASFYCKNEPFFFLRNVD